jgi:hypothetical protein
MMEALSDWNPNGFCYWAERIIANRTFDAQEYLASCLRTAFAAGVLMHWAQVPST